MKDKDYGVQLEVELECGTPILLGLEDVVSNPIQVSKVQQHGGVLNLDVKPLIKINFEDMVADTFSAKESIDMSTRLSLVIELKDGLDSISLKDN